MDHSNLALLSVSVDQDRIDRVRQIAAARQVSKSQVVREALALALAQWGKDMDDPLGPERDRNQARARAQINVRWIRGAPRYAARHVKPDAR